MGETRLGTVLEKDGASVGVVEHLMAAVAGAGMDDLTVTLDGPELKFRTWVDKRGLDFMRANKPGVAILPIIQNVTGGQWNGPGLAKLLKDPVRAKALQGNLISFLTAEKLQQVVRVSAITWRNRRHN